MDMQRLIGELIGLARATDGSEHLICPSATAVIRQCLTAGPEADLDALKQLVETEKRKMVPDCFLCACPCGRTAAFDLKRLDKEPEAVRQAKLSLLQGIRALAACQGLTVEEECFFYKALVVIGLEGLGEAELPPILQELETLQAKH